MPPTHTAFQRVLKVQVAIGLIPESDGTRQLADILTMHLRQLGSPS